MPPTTAVITTGVLTVKQINEVMGLDERSSQVRQLIAKGKFKNAFQTYVMPSTIRKGRRRIWIVPAQDVIEYITSEANDKPISKELIQAAAIYTRNLNRIAEIERRAANEIYEIRTITNTPQPELLFY